MTHDWKIAPLILFCVVVGILLYLGIQAYYGPECTKITINNNTFKTEACQ